MKYRIYIDEVGNSDLESSDNPNHRFLSLTGVIIELGYVEQVLHPDMETIKTRFFDHHPDDPVIFHRKEILNTKPPFQVLKEDAVRDEFDSMILSKLSSWNYQVISVCVDKKKHKETYTAWRYDPYHYCMAVLIERFVFFLDSKEAVGDVLAESRGGKEDKRLKDSFYNLYTNGTDFLDADRIQDRLTSCRLKIKSKANNIAGLQLADLVAHPSRDEILHEKGLLEKPLGPFGQKIMKILQGKYYQKEGRCFGKKLL